MSYKGTVWVTGSRGYLGHEMVRRLKTYNFIVYDSDKDIDITDLDAVMQFADRIHPDVIINCAGIRREQSSAENRIDVYRVNTLGARNLAEASNLIGAIMVQISSDDVFESRAEPYSEFDFPHPTSIYGKSKLAAETLVRELNPRHIIIRSSFIYHANGGRLKNIFDAATSGKKLTARTDQNAAATSTTAYTEFVVRAIQEEQFGTYHVASRGYASRYEFAALALELAGFDPDKVLIPETDLETAANVVLEPLMMDLTGIMDMPAWRDDLRSYLKECGAFKEGE